MNSNIINNKWFVGGDLVVLSLSCILQANGFDVSRNTPSASATGLTILNQEYAGHR